MFSVKKDLSFKRDRDHARYTYWDPFPVLYVDKLGLFDFFKIPVQVLNISKSGMLVRVQSESKFSLDEGIIIKFDNYFTDVIPSKVVRWQPEAQLLAVKFSREIKLVERIALNIT
ncbi:PilZ domain-containing protein [Moritella sp. Urea-trap-13]|uniref:PilZ domain-containing protein n=1 Tax=Moritella sp. Urea-trap-13 TaxID=2058327 RepID=UPI000C31C4F4|nr:PilZ domain-containing protein [Moritella sp. Urea-trap-13]PKH06999.1 PilZ domain-containing protein [Moritella sp. Urea-trap-13]